MGKGFEMNRVSRPIGAISALVLSAALIGGFLYFFFRVLGKREAKRRAAAAQRARDENDRSPP